MVSPFRCRHDGISVEKIAADYYPPADPSISTEKNNEKYYFPPANFLSLVIYFNEKTNNQDYFFDDL
jgi:hypothetical protein